MSVSSSSPKITYLFYYFSISFYFYCSNIFSTFPLLQFPIWTFHIISMECPEVESCNDSVGPCPAKGWKPIYGSKTHKKLKKCRTDSTDVIHLFQTLSSVSRIRNPYFKKNVKYRFQESLPIPIIRLSNDGWRQRILQLADPPTGRISTTCSQGVLRFVVTL
jgi:hypothetical protein